MNGMVLFVSGTVNEACMRSIVSWQVLFFFLMVSIGSFMSKTKIMRSEKIVSSNVEWNASISERGKRSMKPTVSVNRNFLFENSISLVVVDSVVNNALSTLAVASDKA